MKHRTFGWLTKAMTKDIDEHLIGENRFTDHDDLATLATDIVNNFLGDLDFDPVIKVNGPNKLVTYDIKKNLYKQLGFMGGEQMTFSHCRIGKRDGLLLVWDCDEIPGGKQGGQIETTCRKRSHTEAVCLESKDEMYPFLHKLVGMYGEMDLVDHAESIAAELKAKQEKERLAKMKIQKEHYGGGFGAWS